MIAPIRRAAEEGRGGRRRRRPGWRRRASPPSAAIRSPCWKRPAQAGGQVRLAAQNPRRKELIGIVDWRLAELERLGVEHPLRCLGGDRTTCWRWRPTSSIVATGGLPQNPPLDAGDDLVTSSWDIIAGAAKPAENVLLYDDNGGHPGMTRGGADRQCGREARAGLAGALLRAGNGRHEPRALYARLPREGRAHHHQHAAASRSAATATSWSRRSARISPHGWSEERRVDQVVVEHGTLPLDDLYFALKPLSKNGGAVDYERLVDGGDIFPADPAGGGLRAVPHRRRGRRPQHPRRHLRRHQVRDADLIGRS